MPTAIQQVQQRLGVHASGQWDSATDGALLAYQQSAKGATYGMDPNGHPDPATLVNLGYYAPADLFTEEWASYLAGTGKKPGHFGRDLRASIDQVPRWAWALLAVSFGGFAYMAYRTDKKRGK
jgi:hypothetical protein